jgi:hypothetical protein
MAKFVTGQSGNPAGRPKGARNKANAELVVLIQEAFTPEDIQALQKKAIEQAMEGKPALLLGLMEYGYSKMPRITEVSGKDGGPLTIQSDIRKL